jgi:thymidine kinase
MKKCTKCGLFLEENFFSKDIRKKDKLTSWCKECKKKAYAKYELNNKEKRIIQRRKYYLENVKKINKYINKKNTEIKTKYGISIHTIRLYGLKTALKVYDRANRKCDFCGSENDLTIHHKDHKGRNYKEAGLPMNNNDRNLQVLCRSCHGRLHAYIQHKK